MWTRRGMHNARWEKKRDKPIIIIENLHIQCYNVVAQASEPGPRRRMSRRKKDCSLSIDYHNKWIERMSCRSCMWPLTIRLWWWWWCTQRSREKFVGALCSLINRRSCCCPPFVGFWSLCKVMESNIILRATHWVERKWLYSRDSCHSRVAFSRPFG